MRSDSQGNYMGENSSQGLSAADISAIENPSKDSRLVDTMSNGWTDEKHILFLNSIEASFVNELYNEQYHSTSFVGWLSRIKKHKGSSGSYEDDLKSDQFKVLHKGCWENQRFESDNNHVNIDNGSFSLSASPWIQHFRSSSILKKTYLKSSDGVDDIEFARPSVQLASDRLDGEATSSKHICSQDSIGSNTEVSDQNFIADELIVGEQSSRICKKRRLGTGLVHGRINAQVVPSRKAHVTPSSDENHACPHTMAAGSSARISEETAGFLPTKTEASLCKNQEVNG